MQQAKQSVTLSRRSFAKAVAAPALVPRRVRKSRPNILLVCTDAHCGRVMGCNGHPEVLTPNLDRLASLGVNFRHAYSCSTPCAPARASMFTGLYASDVGAYCNATCFDGRSPTFANRLRDAGYFCWACGKMDFERNRDYGFKEIDTQHGHSADPDVTAFFRRPTCYRVDERPHIGAPARSRSRDNVVIRHAIDFLRNEARSLTTPWLAYLGLTGTIPLSGDPKYVKLYDEDNIRTPQIPDGYMEERPLPFQVLANYHNISTPLPESRIRRARAGYYARVSELDANLGRLMEELEATGLLESTAIVFTSDHGQMLGEHGLWFYKSLLEGSIRVPLILAGAGLPRGKVIDTPVSHVDLAATLLDLGGVATPRGMRGRSLLPLVRGESGDHPGYAFSECHCEGTCTGSFMIRKGDWKYIYFTWFDPLLFNLKSDPDEYANLAGRPETKAVQHELHSILTSLVDPDAVTRRAFEEQERRLATLIRERSREEFFQLLARRLGNGQARALTHKYYG